MKWRIYAVLCEAGAAWVMARWVSQLGASPRASLQIMWLTALGAGSLYTMFDPFTADPLMHLLGPLLMLMILSGYLLPAAVVSALGVFGKEFALVPLFVSGVTRLQQRRFPEAFQIAAAGLIVLGLWGAWQILLRTWLDYSTANSHSAKLLSGGFLAFWLRSLEPALVVTAVMGAFGGLWVLWPAGVWRGSRQLKQITLAALLPLAVFNYVQQPDRALWNFAFVVMPAAAVVLNRVSPALSWFFVVLQALVSLRLGAQLTFVPRVRVTLVIAMVLALVLVWRSSASSDRTGSST